MYRFAGRARRLQLGEYPALSLKEARLAGLDARRQVGQGIDPGRAKQEAKLERRENTVELLAKDFLDSVAGKACHREYKRIVDKDVLPSMGNLPTKDVRRADIVKVLDGIRERARQKAKAVKKAKGKDSRTSRQTGDVQANRTRAVISSMFSYAIEHELAEVNPCSGIRSKKEQSRDRVLSPAEVKQFWNHLDQTSMSASSRLALRFLLVTAQRQVDARRAEWIDINLEEKVWMLPAEKTKNRTANRMPLNSLAMEMLTHIKVVAGASRWLFPSPRGDKPICDTALCRALERNLDELGMEHFTAHDLRRTAITMIAGDLKVDRYVVKSILNHKEGSDVTSRYVRTDYPEQKKAAMNAWDVRLREIVAR